MQISKETAIASAIYTGVFVGGAAAYKAVSVGFKAWRNRKKTVVVVEVPVESAKGPNAASPEADVKTE